MWGGAGGEVWLGVGVCGVGLNVPPAVWCIGLCVCCGLGLRLGGVGLADMNARPTCAVLGVIILCLQRNGYSNPILFGLYLAIAGWIALLWASRLPAVICNVPGLCGAVWR